MMYKFRYTLITLIFCIFFKMYPDTKSVTSDKTNTENKDISTMHADTPPKPISAPKYQEKTIENSNSSTNNNSPTTSISNNSSNKDSDKDSSKEDKKSSSNNKEKSETAKKTPEIEVKPQNIITSVYIQNNFGQNCILKKIEILLANQAEPFVKDNLNIQIAAAKKIYTRGTITAFDITTTDSVKSFNGIKSILIDTDIINFDNPNIGSSKLQPILITKKNSKWVLDK